jgi:hypothetical protein
MWCFLHALTSPQAGNRRVEEDARRVGQYEAGAAVDSAQDLAHRLLTTVYMGTVNSSAETCSRAAELAAQVHFSSNLEAARLPASSSRNACACTDRRGPPGRQDRHCSERHGIAAVRTRGPHAALQGAALLVGT